MAGPQAVGAAYKASTPIKFKDSLYGQIGNTYYKNSVRITPNNHAKDNFQANCYTDLDGAMHIDFTGSGYEINAQDIQNLVLVREYENGFRPETLYSPRQNPPKKVIVTIDGNFNRFHGTPIGAEVIVNGDSNIIETSDDNDSVTINGQSNIVYAFDGDDKVTIQNGDGNSVFLGDGNDAYSAPKGSKANYVWSGPSGHNSIKNGFYIKNKNLDANNRRAFLASVKQKAETAGNAISETGAAMAERAKEAYSVAKDAAGVISTGAKKAAEYNPWLDKLNCDEQLYRNHYGTMMKNAGYDKKTTKETLDAMGLDEKEIK